MSVRTNASGPSRESEWRNVSKVESDPKIDRVDGVVFRADHVNLLGIAFGSQFWARTSVSN